MIGKIWQRVGKYVAALATAAGLVATYVGVWYPYQIRKQDTRIAVRKLLAEAIDAFAGQEGATAVMFPSLRTSADDQRLELARRKISEALALDREFGPTYEALGMYWQAKGNTAKAVAAFTRAMELDPSSPTAHIGLGNLLQRDKSYAAALAEFEKAVECAPGYYEAYVTRGAAYLLRFDHGRDPNDINAAEADFRIAIRLDPARSEAYVHLAERYVMSEDVEQVQKNARAAIDRNPADGRPYLFLAIALASQRRLAEVETAVRHSIELAPASGATFFTLSRIFERQGKFRQSVAASLEALKYGPTNARWQAAYVALCAEDPIVAQQVSEAYRTAPDPRQLVLGPALPSPAP